VELELMLQWYCMATHVSMLLNTRLQCGNGRCLMLYAQVNQWMKGHSKHFPGWIDASV